MQNCAMGKMVPQMLNITDILNAINRKVVEEFPGLPFYIEQVPQRFRRPSFCLEYDATIYERKNRRTKEVQHDFTLTYFGIRDAYGNQDMEDILAVQDRILKVFDAGYLTVAERAVKITAMSGGQYATNNKHDAEVYVTLHITYCDGIAEAEQRRKPMQDIQIHQKTV